MRVIGVRNIESWCTLQHQVVNEKHQALSIEWALFPIGLIKSWMSRSCRKKRTQTASVFIASMTSRHRGCFRDFRKMVAKTGSWNLPMLPLCGVSRLPFTVRQTIYCCWPYLLNRALVGILSPAPPPFVSFLLWLAEGMRNEFPPFFFTLSL